MTTVAADLESMSADTLVSYSSNFEGRPKIWAAKHSLWGAAGNAHDCAAFRLWTLGKGKKPVAGQKPQGSDDEEAVRLEVLQLHQDSGLFLWVNNDLPEAIKIAYYAIGSGGSHALGAMAMKATPEEAISVAALFDSATGGRCTTLRLADIGRRARRGR